MSLFANQTLINRFADLLADQRGKTSQRMQPYAHDSKSQPTENYETVMQRSYEQLFHEPEIGRASCRERV